MRVMVDPALPNHRKIGRLMDSLGCSRREAIGTVVTLWCNVMTQAEDGILENWTPTEIGRAAGAPETALESTYKALLSSGFLEVEKPPNSRVRLHEWFEHQGDIKAKRAAWEQQRSRTKPTHAIPTQATPYHTKPGVQAPARGLPGASQAPTPTAGNGLPALTGTDETDEERAKYISEAKAKANGLSERGKNSILDYIGWLDSKGTVPGKRILENSRKLCNIRQGMEITMGEKLPHDRIFDYGIKQAIEHDAPGVSYAAKVFQTEYMRHRDGCPRG